MTRLSSSGSRILAGQISPIGASRTIDHHAYRPLEDDQQSEIASLDKKSHRENFQQARSLVVIVSEWRWEFACWLFGTLCIAAMVVILAYFDGKRLDEWDSRIQISSIISALSQAAQSALMVEVSSCIGQSKWPWLEKDRQMIDIRRFDDASRGPEGSLLLLARAIRRPEGLFISIGALVTVLMLAFGTFTQQTIRILNRDVSEPSIRAELAYAAMYKPPSSPFGSTVLEAKEMQKGINFKDLHMSKAIMSGVAGDNHSLSDVAGSCIADRCTWPSIDTLAICVGVEDMSSEVISQSNRSSESMFTVAGAPIPPPFEDFAATYWMASTSYGSAALPAQRERANSKLSGIADVYILHWDPCSRNTTSDEYNHIMNAENWRAYKASFAPCIQSLSSKSNLTMNTTVREERTDIEWQTMSTWERPPEVRDGNWTMNHWCDSQNTSLCISNSSMFTIGDELSKLFAGYAFLFPGSPMMFTGPNTAYLVADILGSDPTTCNSTADASRLRYAGFSNRMQNIATAITNAMRTADSHATILGTAYQRQSYIVVEFGWFLFPAALWFLATVFFFVTVVGSKRGDVPVWKSNPLVLLQATDEHNGMETLKIVNDKAKNTDIALRRNGKRWRLQYSRAYRGLGPKANQA